jgi:hypothetical protein
MDRWGDISDDDIKERYRQIGGEPSDVFSFDKDILGRQRQANILDRQRRAMSRLSSHQRMAIASVGWNDTSTFSPNQRICAIMGYGQSGDDFPLKMPYLFLRQITKCWWRKAKAGSEDEMPCH